MCDRLPYELLGSQSKNDRGGEVVGLARDEAGIVIENFFHPGVYGAETTKGISEEEVLEFVFLCDRYGFRSITDLEGALEGTNQVRRREAKLIELISERRGVTKEACEAYFTERYVPTQTVEQWFRLFFEGKNPPVPKKGFKAPIPVEFVVYDEPCSLSVELTYNKRLTEIIKEKPNKTVSELILYYEFGALGIRPWRCYPDRRLIGYKGERSSGEESV
ncbi:hypothetical protein [Actinidia virus C]|nr:hypothetical protein [Actinidia virus C]QJD14812.1 hypothetical protein [Actinidia virus C]